MAIPWILISVGVLIVLLAVVALAYKKKGVLKPWTSEQWIEAGAIFLLVTFFASRFGRDYFVLGFLGIIYLAVGFSRKYLFKKKKTKK